MRARVLSIAALSVLFAVSACGGDDDDSTADAGNSADDPAFDLEGNDGDIQDAADELAGELEDQQNATGGGRASITVDGETWDFAAIQCAFGEDEIGQEGAELVVSAIADGLQFYVSIDSFGNSISIDDIEDFENPSVAWSAAELAPGDEVTIDVDGKEVSGSSDAFRDGNDELSGTTASGSFEATCP